MAHSIIISATRKSYFATRAMSRAAFDMRDAEKHLGRATTPRQQIMAESLLASATRRFRAAETRFHNAQRVLCANPLPGDAK